MALGGFLALFMLGSGYAIWWAYVTPPPPQHKQVLAFGVPGKCQPFVKDYIAPGKSTRMSPFKYLHLKEILTICEAGKDPSKVAYNELTRADMDVAYKHAIDQQIKCGGAPCDMVHHAPWPIHTGVPAPR